MTTVFSDDGWRLTGRTRWAMKGFPFFKKPAIQVEETTNSTATETNTFSSYTEPHTRWRFANDADMMNLEDIT